MSRGFAKWKRIIEKGGCIKFVLTNNIAYSSTDKTDFN
jgi:hypothetical protein